MPNVLVFSGKSCRIFMASACALMGLTALPASGGIVYFDVNPDLTLNVGDTANFGDINVVTATYTPGSTTGNFFGLTLTSNQTRYAIFEGTGNGTIEWAFEGEAIVPKLALNTEISGTSPWPWDGWDGFGVALANDNLLTWGSGGTGYAALRIDQGGGNYNYGWAEISYTPNGASTTATVTGFAFQGDANTSILAGATVPEPSTCVMALAGLACGGYSMFRRRKRA
jgi:hypothetical protein